MKILIRFAAVFTCFLSAILWVPVWIFTGKNIMTDTIEWWENKLAELNVKS